MKKIIKLMNINVDSVVFIDDNEFETSQINYFFPQVITANNTEELELIVRNQLENYVGKTYENYNRRELMLNRMKRQEEQNNFKGTNEQFLASCEMSLTIRRAKENDILRIEELAVRTNQLNNFKKKVNVCTIQEYLILEDRALYVCELEDRFGNHGIVGSCFIRIDGDKAIVKQFCISCRIEGRGIGYSFLSHVIHNIQQRYSDITMIICDFCVSSKNSSALYLLKALGFKYLNEKENYSVYSVKIPHKYSKVNWLKVINMEEI
jgi:methoxymalonate biosynthesis protein